MSEPSPAPPCDAAPRWAVLLPVKPPTRGKSRLSGPPEITADVRTALARAFALDTAEACLATPGVAHVLVVTDDALFAHELRRLGCSALPDGVSGDLNASLVQAAAEARRRWPGTTPVVLCADLPALRPTDLATALAGIDPDAPAYVRDAAGTGTTLYAAPYQHFAPHFGAGSAQAHRDAGAVAVAGALPTLRHDVDTLDDLRGVAGYGLGPRTARTALRAGLVDATG